MAPRLELLVISPRPKVKALFSAVGLALLVTLVLSAPSMAAGPTTERVSVSSSGAQAEVYSTGSWRHTVSADGRFVLFYAQDGNLVRGDTNEADDVFLRDRSTGLTTRVSVSSSERQANGSSYLPAISDDGRFVAFESSANNLVSGDTNGASDVFLRDLAAGTTVRVSVNSSEAQAKGNSVVGSVVAVSNGGRFVFFNSNATNLVSKDTNGVTDLFVRDRQVGTTARVSVSSSGAQANSESYGDAASRDGRFVTFHSYASNLVPGDTNNVSDAFLRDRLSGKTVRVSVSSSEVQGNDYTSQSDVSSDGRFVVFDSRSTNFVRNDANSGERDVFVRDRQMGTTALVSRSSAGIQGNDPSYEPVISNDGRSVAFVSFSTNLVSADTNGVEDVFLRDIAARATTRASVTASGAQAKADCDGGTCYGSNTPSISGDGRFVAFSSPAALVASDTNGAYDVYIRGPLR